MSAVNTCAADHQDYYCTAERAWCGHCGAQWPIPVGATNADIVRATIEEFIEYEGPWDDPNTRYRPDDFGQLHSLFDANMLADELVSRRTDTGERYLNIICPVQDEVDHWLKTRHARRQGK